MLYSGPSWRPSSPTYLVVHRLGPKRVLGQALQRASYHAEVLLRIGKHKKVALFPADAARALRHRRDLRQLCLVDKRPAVTVASIRAQESAVIIIRCHFYLLFLTKDNI